MARRSKSSSRAPSPGPKAHLPPAGTATGAPSPGPAPVAPPARRPAPAAGRPAPRGFWTGFEIAWAKWVGFRWVFFSLLAIDAYLQLPHAPRYGAGGFNVQHLGAVLPEPGRELMTALYAAMCVLFALIAGGALVRVLLPIATALYGYAYFASQLDSYQHHYLVWLLLVLLCLVPIAPTEPGPAPAVRSWALRLVLVQLAIVYFYAAVSKLDPAWLDGATLSRQISAGTVRDVLDRIGWSTLAVVVVVTELGLAATIWWRRLWPWAFVAGVGLHVGIEIVGLEIGLFSYLMFALYLLLLPDRLFTSLGQRGAAIAAFFGRRSPHAWAAGALALTAATLAAMIHVTAFLSRSLTLALAAGLAIGWIAACGRAWRRGEVAAAIRRGLIVASAAAVPTIAAYATDTGPDYYRFWGGAARRLGDYVDARRAYEGLLAIDPESEYAHYYLGELDRGAGALDAALDHYRAAQRSMPTRARAFVGEAMVHVHRGAAAPARAALDTALRIDPNNADARRLSTTLGPPAPRGHE